MPWLYYTNAARDNKWETLKNWNTQSDGRGTNATSVPWVEGYQDHNLAPATQDKVIIASKTTVGGTGTHARL